MGRYVTPNNHIRTPRFSTNQDSYSLLLDPSRCRCQCQARHWSSEFWAVARSRSPLGSSLGVAFDSAEVCMRSEDVHGRLHWVFVAGDDEERDTRPGLVLSSGITVRVVTSCKPAPPSKACMYSLDGLWGLCGCEKL
jgi:hypothetical protein